MVKYLKTSKCRLIDSLQWSSLDVMKARADVPDVWSADLRWFRSIRFFLWTNRLELEFKRLISAAGMFCVVVVLLKEENSSYFLSYVFWK